MECYMIFHVFIMDEIAFFFWVEAKQICQLRDE